MCFWYVKNSSLIYIKQNRDGYNNCSHNPIYRNTRNNNSERIPLFFVFAGISYSLLLIAVIYAKPITASHREKRRGVDVGSSTTDNQNICMVFRLCLGRKLQRCPSVKIFIARIFFIFLP